MPLSELRYTLTQHTVRFLLTYENFRLLIHPSIEDIDLLHRLEDDINLMPKIPKTIDNIDIKFYRFGYDESIYSKSELLSFIYASINEEWSVIEGIDLSTNTTHFWLKQGEIIYDPSLAIVTNELIYSKYFKEVQEIKNESLRTYLIENDNLHKFYNNKPLFSFMAKKKTNFSIKFIDRIKEAFNKNIRDEYELNESRIESIREHFMLENFIELRQVLTKKRKWYLKSSNIAVHPSIDDKILESIKKVAIQVRKLMKEEYNIFLDYYENTTSNCYGLSIMFNLFDGSFKLVQGGIPYQREEYNGVRNYFFQHSWLEKDGIVYDPALRIITPAYLYYTFVQKQDEYSKEETENILRRIGFNLTHFKDFMNGKRIGNDETIMYRTEVNKIDSEETKEKGEKLLSLVKKYKQEI